MMCSKRNAERNRLGLGVEDTFTSPWCAPTVARSSLQFGARCKPPKGRVRRRDFTLAGSIMRRGQGRSSAVVLIVALALLSGCATSKPEMAWVRTDGRKILDDPALLKKGETDIALCNANLDSGAVDDGARKCMGLKGYALVRKDEAEDARAGFAAAQRVSTPSAGGGSK